MKNSRAYFWAADSALAYGDWCRELTHEQELAYHELREYQLPDGREHRCLMLLLLSAIAESEES